MLGASMLALSQLAWSLGLGEVKVESFLGEPLEVKIELITSPSDDLASLRANLASAADYELVGASLDDVSVPLWFSVEDLDGGAYIAVSSSLDINNPVMRLILEVNWSSGRMLREYTLFLDPPTFNQPAPAPGIEAERVTEAQASRPAPAPGIEAARVTEAQASQPAPAPRIEAARVTEAQASQPAPATAITTMSDAAILGTNDYGPVQSGETLWRIAFDWSAGSGFSINQVMLAIQRNNPQAFSRNNINLLRLGAILRMPQRGDINSISFAVANSEVQKQIDAFESRRSINIASPAVPLLAEESIAIEPVQQEKMGEQSGEQLAQSEESLPTELPTDLAPSQLELIPPSEDNPMDSTYGFEESEAATDDAESVRALREELSRKEEELINQQQQNTYLEQRLQELESQLGEIREGTVEDKNLASMEERLRAERLRDSQTAVPIVVSSPTPEEPWYNRFSLRLLGLLVLVAVVAGWFMSRRGSPDTVVSDLGGDTDPLREIKDEAEDVLRVPDSSPKGKVATGEGAQQQAIKEGVAAEPETSATGESEETQTIEAGKYLSDEDVDARVLDEESADPEIQLDLARAYISMGDKEAARVILEEVIANGSEDQQAEANKMKDRL